jgi:predicted Rossmann fold flavoprotein
MNYDVLIIGAGAAGMMCAIEAGKRGRSVLLIDHAETVGEKIRISGGGRCNFTNLHCGPHNFLSKNPHFSKSALSRYTPQDFIKLVEKHGIAWHEKTLGQLFCDISAKQIISMLRDEMRSADVRLEMETSVAAVIKTDKGFTAETNRGGIETQSLVIATGGLSIPKIGATGFAYDVARQFGLRVIEPRAALVPLIFRPDLLALTRPLSGVSVDPAEVGCDKTVFREALLFTHRGLSGPAILQISSYWKDEDISVNLLPDADLFTELSQARQNQPRQMLRTVLGRFLPQRLAEVMAAQSGADEPMGNLSDVKLKAAADAVQRWRIRPAGTEGFRTAEVTLGGVDTDEISSKTFAAHKAPGLYFIGEALDVTGHLGGHNFQWAWSSGWCAGQFV